MMPVLLFLFFFFFFFLGLGRLMNSWFGQAVLFS